MRPALLPLLLVLGCAASPPRPREPGAPGGGRAREVRVTILSTMLAEAGIGEWGFAALVEVDGRRLLFDTGERPRTVLENARELELDLASVPEVVLSHHHGDHTGGLLTLREELAPVSSSALATAHVGRMIFARRVERGGSEEQNPMVEIRPRFGGLGGAFVEHALASELHPGVWLTGPIARVHPERNWSGDGLVVLDDREVEDTLPEDMALVIDTESGLIVIVGCGHAGIVNTLEAARRHVRDAPILAVIGGLHLFAATEEALSWTASELHARGVKHLLGAHCTGIEATWALRERAGLSRGTCAVGAVGATFTLRDGISPGVLAR